MSERHVIDVYEVMTIKNQSQSPTLALWISQLRCRVTVRPY